MKTFWQESRSSGDLCLAFCRLSPDGRREHAASDHGHHRPHDQRDPQPVRGVALMQQPAYKNSNGSGEQEKAVKPGGTGKAELEQQRDEHSDDGGTNDVDDEVGLHEASIHCLRWNLKVVRVLFSSFLKFVRISDGYHRSGVQKSIKMKKGSRYRDPSEIIWKKHYLFFLFFHEFI